MTIKQFLLYSFDKLSPIIMENFLLQFENKGHTPIHKHIYAEKHFSLTVLLLPFTEREGWNKLYSKKHTAPFYKIFVLKRKYIVYDKTL